MMGIVLFLFLGMGPEPWVLNKVTPFVAVKVPEHHCNHSRDLLTTTLRITLGHASYRSMGHTSLLPSDECTCGHLQLPVMSSFLLNSHGLF